MLPAPWPEGNTASNLIHSPLAFLCGFTYTIVFHLLALVLSIQVLTLRVLFCVLFSRCAHGVHSYSSFIFHCCVVIQHVTIQPSIHGGKGTWAVSNGCYLGLLCGGLLLAVTFILISFSWCMRERLCGTASRWMHMSSLSGNVKLFPGARGEGLLLPSLCTPAPPLPPPLLASRESSTDLTVSSVLLFPTRGALLPGDRWGVGCLGLSFTPSLFSPFPFSSVSADQTAAKRLVWVFRGSAQPQAEGLLRVQET